MSEPDYVSDEAIIEAVRTAQVNNSTAWATPEAIASVLEIKENILERLHQLVNTKRLAISYAWDGPKASWTGTDRHGKKASPSTYAIVGYLKDQPLFRAL